MNQNGLGGTLPGGAALSGSQQARLQKLADTQEGQRVRALLGNEAELNAAIQQGDGAALRKAMTTVMQDPAGRSFLNRLSELMGKP